MARNPDHVTVLQVAPAYLAYSRARTTPAGFDVEGGAVEYGDWDASGDMLAPALADFAQRYGFADDPIYLVLPRHEAAVRIIELPTQDADEMRGMVHLSAEEIVPFPLRELLTAYCVLDTLPGGSSRVLAAVVRQSVVEAALNVASAAGLRVEQILLSTSCLITGLRAAAAEPIAAAVHVAPDGFEVAVLREGELVWGRGVSQAIASGPGPVAPAAFDELVAELHATLASCRRDSPDGAAVGEVLLSATGVEAADLAARLGLALGVPVRSVGDCVSGGALADALGDRTYHVSLIPESELRRRTAARARTRLVRFGAAAAVAVLSAAALYAQVFVQRRDYVRELDARAEQLRPVARTLLAKRQQLKLIQDQVDRSFSPLRILNEIAGVAPDSGVNFSRFSFDQHDGVVAQGSAVNPKLFDDLIDNIRGADLDAFPQLARARELYRTARVERSRQVWDFAVTIPFAEPETND